MLKIRFDKDSLLKYSLGLCIIFGLNYLYLINTDKLNIQGVFNADFFALIFASFWGAFVFVVLKDYPSPKYKYGIWILVLMLMVFFSSLQSKNLYSQSLVQGIRPQRTIILWGLLYFPISKLLFYYKFSISDVKKILYVIGTIELILFLLQYFFRGQLSFLYVHSGQRYNDSRFYFQCILLDLIFCFKVEDFIYKKKKVKSLIYIISILFEIMVVQKFRLTTLGLLIVLILGFLMIKKNLKKKLIYLFILIIGVFILLQTEILNDVFNSINYGDINLDIRSDARKWYFSTLSLHPFLGGGYPSTLNFLALNASGSFYNYLLVDNGIFGFMYMYGFLGILWFVTLWFSILKVGIYIYNKRSEISYFLFPLFLVITMINEIHWYWDNGFIIFILFICILEQSERNIKNKLI